MVSVIENERRSYMCLPPLNIKINENNNMGGLWLRIERLWREKNLEYECPDDVLDMIAQIPFNERTPRMLTIQGLCMQLTERVYELSDIEVCFRRALKIEPEYVDAMIQLAYFLDVVKNEPRKAIYWFRRARRVTRYYFKEIENGIKNVGDSFAIQ